MSYDLNVLCFMQKKKVKLLPFPSPFDFKVYHKGKNSYPKYYGDTWYFMEKCSGFLYYLFPKEEIFGETWGCGDLCDTHHVARPAPTNHCLPDELAEHVSELNTVIWIKKKYIHDFERIINYFLSESPANMIIFLPRFQDHERGIVHGVISRNQFFSMMKNKKIRLNMCYIIRKWYTEFLP